MSESDEGTPRPPKRFEDVADGETSSRTAAHEAGHVLAAWLSWAVASVEGTVFSLDEGHSRVSVHRTFKRPYTAIQLWEGLVISSGGMAGEVVTHVTFHTSNCRVDINAMRIQVEMLAKAFGASLRPPWPEPGGHKAPPFERYFEGGLPDGWGDLMRSAYRRAKDLILLHRGAFERLRTAMLVKIELTTAEIEAALRMPKA
ncbi:MAG TPA: hypothetical protein VL283_05795 [Candidatus Baltobacteraceae bacterium]|nr:hypothetical protein [Candidatus Baltobacteraceae bacterium]